MIGEWVYFFFLLFVFWSDRNTAFFYIPQNSSLVFWTISVTTLQHYKAVRKTMYKLYPLAIFLVCQTEHILKWQDLRYFHKNKSRILTQETLLNPIYPLKKKSLLKIPMSYLFIPKQTHSTWGVGGGTYTKPELMSHCWTQCGTVGRAQA